MKRCKSAARQAVRRLLPSRRAARRLPPRLQGLQSRQPSAAKYRENPQPNIDRVKRWQQRQPGTVSSETQREYAASGKRSVADRKSYLKRKYGMTLEEYERMLEAQGGVCAICRQPRPEERTLHVDHDHETGRDPRAACASSCNNALGDFRDERRAVPARGRLSRPRRRARGSRPQPRRALVRHDTARRWARALRPAQ